MRRRTIMFLAALAALAVLALGAVATTSAFNRESSPAKTSPEQAPAQAQQELKGPHQVLGILVADTVDGVLVMGVAPNSPAGQAGVRRGDLITALNGNAVQTVSELRDALKAALPDPSQGGSVTLTLRHNGTTANVTVTLEPREQRPGRPFLGVIAMPINQELKDRMGLSRDSGVVIAGIVPDSPAQQGDLRRGDIFIRFGDQDINSLTDLVRALGMSQPGDQVAIVVLRSSQEVTINVTLGERQLPIAKPRIVRSPLLNRLRELGALQGHLRRLLKAEITVPSDGGQATYQVIQGELKGRSDIQIRVAPAAGGSEITFAIASDTRIIGDPQVGQPVMVVTKDDHTKLIVNLSERPRPALPGIMLKGVAMPELVNITENDVF